MLNNSYAYLEKSVEGSCISLEVDDLTQTINGKVTLAAGKAEKLELVVKNNDNIASKYQMIYMSENDLIDVSVGYASESVDLPYGDINSNESKNVIITLQNNSSNEVVIEIGVKGGLSQNSVEDIILENGENKINQVLDVIIKTEGTPTVTLLGSSYTGGTTYTIDCSSQISNYQDLTADHFYTKCNFKETISGDFNGDHHVYYMAETKSYDNTTGTLTYTPPYAQALAYIYGSQQAYPTCSIYCIH